MTMFVHLVFVLFHYGGAAAAGGAGGGGGDDGDLLCINAVGPAENGGPAPVGSTPFMLGQLDLDFNFLLAVPNDKVKTGKKRKNTGRPLIC
jgi:hypothetical protein